MEDAEIERVLREYDIFQAAKAGLLIPCQEIVDRLGHGVLHQYDREGHTPLHWASLGGHSHVVRFFIECQVSQSLALSFSKISQFFAQILIEYIVYII